MRDFVSCFSEYAVQVSDNTSCRSSHSNTSCINPSSPLMIPSVQFAVTSLYKSIPLSNHREMLITITWSKSNSSQTLTINFNDEPTPSFRLSTSARLFKKLKGIKSLELQSSKIDVLWDISSAKYDSGPEPINDYYLIVVIDSEPGLILGDPTHEILIKDMKFKTEEACKFSLISRQEHFLGNTLYSTRARFCDTGEEHEISIRFNGEKDLKHHPVLSVSIDEKMVILVKRLQWNFRGNQTIFFDGLSVDMMWDLHDWFRNNDNNNQDLRSYGIFMFKARSGIESRLWLEDKKINVVDKKDDHHHHQDNEFTLMIYACKNS